MRLIFVLISAMAGIVVAYFGQPFVHKNSDANTLLITVFTVFAGFLVAIIAVVGDPQLLPAGNWRKAENMRERVESRLLWQLYLFVCYLLTIGLIFVSVLLKDATLSPILCLMVKWVERAYLALSVFCFFVSFALPWTLLTIQRTRIDAEIAKRREEAGLST